MQKARAGCHRIGCIYLSTHLSEHGCPVVSGQCVCVSLYVCVCVCACVSVLVTWSFANPWTVACQVPLSIGFSWQEYWSGFPFPSPGDLPEPEIEPGYLAL